MQPFDADPEGGPSDLPQDPQALTALVLARLDEDQAQDVVVIDLKGKSSLADEIIIASGRSQRHVAAMSDHLLRAIKTAGFGRAQSEGLPHADWVLIDAGDVIVHLFRPEVRAFYNIEKIWSVEPPRPSRPHDAATGDAAFAAEDDEQDEVGDQDEDDGELGEDELGDFEAADLADDGEDEAAGNA